MRLWITFFFIKFFISISFSQTFNYGPTNFDVVKKINVGEKNASKVFRASNLASLKGIIGSPYRNTFFEIGIIYRNNDSWNGLLKKQIHENGAKARVLFSHSSKASKRTLPSPCGVKPASTPPVE